MPHDARWSMSGILAMRKKGRPGNGPAPDSSGRLSSVPTVQFSLRRRRRRRRSRAAAVDGFPRRRTLAVGVDSLRPLNQGGPLEVQEGPMGMNGR
jgi:hypothetical protein